MSVQRDGKDIELDIDELSSAIREYPVRCAILYGSHVHRTDAVESDVDIAVAFDDTLSECDRLQCRISLTATLVETLSTDAVDVTDLDAIRPAVGLAAVNTGYLLLGDQETLETYRTQFEREVGPAETHKQRMERFDAILDRLEETV